MKVLVVGSGGREHALCWGLSRSRRVTTLRCAPGNAGIARIAEPVEVRAEDVDGIVEHASSESYDLVVIGPEAPLVAGVVDRLQACGIPAFGPSAAAARLEGSKAHAKRFMARHGIPTAAFREFDRFDDAESYLRDRATRIPIVVKADGLAAGKGVVVATDRDQAVRAAREMLVEGKFGQAGSRIVIEDALVGREASFFVLVDGKRHVQLATCQDYKRAGDGDLGPNTGGMGSYSPSAHLDDALRATIERRIVEPTLSGLEADGTPYRGVLYFGLMLTEHGPEVLEYNCRFGDPETQALIPRLEGDWATILDACVAGRLSEERIAWKDSVSVCVVMTAGGYPGAYAKGTPIEGLDLEEDDDDVVVFHAGTAGGAGSPYRTAGGRVLGVTALGETFESARARAYDRVSKIRFSGAQYRTDIAADAAPSASRSR